jgi:hypothetical protein
MQKTLVAVLVEGAHVAHPDRIALDGAPMLAVERSAVETLLHHAAFAAQLVGHLGDNAQSELIGQIGDRVDTVVHGLTELLGAPSVLADPNATPAGDRVARNGVPMLTSIAGGTP